MSQYYGERIKFLKKLKTPQELLNELPLPINSKNLVFHTIKQIQDILDGKSNKLVLIVGPCSIHDPEAAIEYAQYLKTQIDLYQDRFVIVMRTYFSKSQTSSGWKGLINDPDLNNTYNITKGLYVGRKLLIDILSIGVPCAMEQLDTILPQYFNDLLSWSAIGARTTESQVHRELASGISMPVGFKNNTNGNVQVAINAIKCSSQEHTFIGCDMTGNLTEVLTSGNEFGHVILRGSDTEPNYYSKNVREVEDKLEECGLPKNIFIDFSHGNSQKNYKNQYLVAIDIAKQIINGNKSIKGMMIESNITEGNQDIDVTNLQYGISITDECINLEMTSIILELLNNARACAELCERITDISFS